MPIGIEEFLKSATPEQKQLLFDLGDLAKKEHDFAEKINRICSCPGKGQGIYDDGMAVTLCESDDDVAIISAGPRRDLKEVRSKIVNLLKKAIKDIGMGDVGIIQRQYKNYVTD